MESLLHVLSLVARALVIFSGGMAAIFFAYAGFQWITSGGDPQKVAQARNSVIGAVVGLVLLGVALIIPEVISEAIIEPAGGIPVGSGHTPSCDAQLEVQLVLHPTASNPTNMDRVIDAIQATDSDCSVDLWAPAVEDTAVSSGDTHCGTSGGSLGGFEVPKTLLHSGTEVSRISKRDGQGNIIVLFDALPSNNHACWMYVAGYKRWTYSG